MNIINYDKTDKFSIERYARNLIDKSLNQICEKTGDKSLSNKKSKGRLGQLVEKNFFGYEINNRQEADFAEAKLELKVCPIKLISRKNKLNNSKNLRIKMGYSAKERMVLSIIDYIKLYDETWENNSLMEKSRELLLMFYIYQKDIDEEDLIFKVVSLWTPTDNDLKIIEKDWNIILSKVKEGKAHEISEGDTMYLGACTKGSTALKSKRKQPRSNTMASQRAFSYKRSYVDYILEELLNKEKNRNKKFDYNESLSDEKKLFDEKIYELFDSMIGSNIGEMMKVCSINVKRKAKNFISLVIKEVCKKKFGNELKNFAEFKKANIEIKTILLQTNGIPKESMSFEQINYCEIINEEWDESTIKNKFENKKHLWIVFKSNIKFKRQSELSLDNIILHKVMFWNMPIKDLNDSMHTVWLDTVNKIKEGEYNNFMKIRDGEIAHIRPKGRNSEDLAITPQGTKEKKKCFWLNAKYISQQIEKN